MLRLAALIAAVLLAAAGARADEDGCASCHRDLAFGPDVHVSAGLSCASCHRGNPAAKTPAAAHAGFVARPRGWAGATLCGGCHGDIEGMRTLNPRLPTDQLAQYSTSQHGKLAQKGDARVATCVSCHGHHGIKHVKDPASSASRERIVDTCTGCHNPEYMAGRDIPTDQLEKYRASVHGHRRLVERDPSAPACNDCHGNHGAAPPGVYAVTHVCGKCHVTQTELFDAGTHAGHFKDAGVAPCTTCHNHHDIMPTSDELLGTGPGGACGMCHEKGDRCDVATLAMKAGLSRLDQSLADARARLAHAERLGMDVERATYDLTPAAEALVRARVVVHAFSEAQVHKVIDDGGARATEVTRTAQAKLDEHTFRRRGLAVAAFFLVMLAGLLALKARRLEQARGPSA
ncbi:MAG TPA: cytochrome c3 family protein [Vicinamibacteria bacterium]|nr:cytochrome c3 family protein [Vicinamibacteria bacterium]